MSLNTGARSSITETQALTNTVTEAVAEQPFASVLQEAPEGHLPDASTRADLAEHGLDGGLAAGIGGASSLGSEEGAHGTSRRGLLIWARETFLG